MTLQASGPFSGERLFADVQRYAQLGSPELDGHRTGGAGDISTSEWLRSELAGVGFDTALQPFTLRQFFVGQASVLLGGESFSAFPHWFPSATAAKGVTAPLKALAENNLNGAIAWVAPKAAGLWYQADISRFAAIAAKRGAQALVVAVPHPSGLIYARNGAEPYLQRSLAIPAVIVAADDASALAAAAEKQQNATVISTGRIEEKSRANNVIARLLSKQADAPWLVVTTPSSGWFAAAGERGGGVALWLALARWAAASPRYFNYLFIASSGHELDFMGAHYSFSNVPEPGQVALWLHLGASIAARAWRKDDDGQLRPMEKVHEYNLLYGDQALLPAIKDVFAAVPDLQLAPNRALNRQTSELGVIVQRGYTAMGMVGAHRFFHTPEDLPVVTSPDLLSPYGAAFKQFFQHLEQAASPLWEKGAYK